jgi:hypothetical protein
MKANESVLPRMLCCILLRKFPFCNSNDNSTKEEQQIGSNCSSIKHGNSHSLHNILGIFKNKV